MKILQRNSVFLLVIVSFTLSDCKKKKDPAPSICYLTELAETYPGGASYMETLIYNDMHQVTSIIDFDASGTRTGTYTYATNGNLQSATFSDGTSRTYTFDNNNRMILRVTSPGGQTLQVSYNASGQNDETTYTDPNCANCSSTSEFDYQNTTTHNYSKLTVTSNSGVFVYTYEYDAHPNPYKPVLYSSTGSDNNPTKIVRSSSSGTQTTTFTYTYNERGYPLTRTGSDGYSAQYTYDCPE